MSSKKTKIWKIIPNDLTETFGDSLDRQDFECSDCPDHGLDYVVLVRDTTNKDNMVTPICGWCLSTHLWQDYWQIKRVYFTHTKTDNRENSHIFIVDKGKVDKNGATYNKYDTKIKQNN